MSELYDFVGYNSAQVVEEAVAKFEEATGTELYAGDERLMLINSFGYLTDIVMAEINYRANNNLIATCDEETLMFKGIERNVTRIPAECATITECFTLSSAQEEAVTISMGTRVTSDGSHFFMTKEETSIAAGATSANIVCVACEAGEEYNDIAIGKINILVDTIPYISAVSNTDVSFGGENIESIESYRKRVLDAPKGYNTTGSEEAYIAKVKEVDASISDVCLVNDNTNVKIYVLCNGGEIPDQNLLNKIDEYITDPSIKTFTDNVTILAAVELDYTISFTYKIATDDSDRVTEIQENVLAAVEKFKNDTKGKLGADINPEKLLKYIYNAGAASATITSPSMYTAVERSKVAICTSSTVIYEGILPDLPEVN